MPLHTLSLPLRQILEHLSLVPEQSRVSVYIRKTLAKKCLSGGATRKPDQPDGRPEAMKSTSNPAAGPTRGKNPTEQSPFLHDGLSVKDLVLLGEIIDKLTPETEHQGLRELYAFQVAHPDVNIPSLFRCVFSLSYTHTLYVCVVVHFNFSTHTHFRCVFSVF